MWVCNLSLLDLHHSHWFPKRRNRWENRASVFNWPYFSQPGTYVLRKDIGMRLNKAEGDVRWEDHPLPPPRTGMDPRQPSLSFLRASCYLPFEAWKLFLEPDRSGFEFCSVIVTWGELCHFSEPQFPWDLFSFNEVISFLYSLPYHVFSFSSSGGLGGEGHEPIKSTMVLLHVKPGGGSKLTSVRHVPFPLREPPICPGDSLAWPSGNQEARVGK